MHAHGMLAEKCALSLLSAQQQPRLVRNECQPWGSHMTAETEKKSLTNRETSKYRL